MLFTKFKELWKAVADILKYMESQKVNVRTFEEIQRLEEIQWYRHYYEKTQHLSCFHYRSALL